MTYLNSSDDNFASLSPSDDPMLPSRLLPADSTGRVILSDDDPANFANPQGESLATVTPIRHPSAGEPWGSRARRRTAAALEWAAHRLSE